MLGIEMHEKIEEFQKRLLKIYFYPPYDRTYPQQLENQIADVFGFENTIIGSLGKKKKLEFDTKYYTHNVSSEFTKEFFSFIWDEHFTFQLKNELFVLSRSLDDGEHILYLKRMLSKHGYFDLLFMPIHYVDSDEFISSILVFQENKAFSHDDIELFSIIRESISISATNQSSLWLMQNREQALKRCMDFFPVGMMLINRINVVTYTNELAKKYLADLGEKDERFYTPFYMEKIHNHFRYSMMSFGESYPLRIKQYLFNYISTTSPGLNLIFSDEKSANADTMPFYNNMNEIMDNITACVFIICDNIYHPQFSYDCFDDFGLTKREREVAEYIAEGLSNSEIAEHMTTSVNTVKRHISNMFHKVGVSSRIEFINKLKQKESEK